MLPFREVIYKDEIKRGCRGLLVGDIGGTNSNFGIACIADGKAELSCSIHMKSAQITDFTQVVKDILEYAAQTYAITIENACFAAAGVVTPKQDFCKPTNLPITIDAKEIMKNTSLQCVFIVNDFEVIGYGIDCIDPKDVVAVQRGAEFKHGNKAILGAGTGLGKAILRWVESKNRYVPVASEGGHADFAAQTAFDIALITFIQHYERYACNISWENVLSGEGIKRIYRFFGEYNNYDKRDTAINNDGPHPDEIFADRYKNKRCKDTFDFYNKIYARCAKNWALNALALGGIYIAGGIAANNVEMFKLPDFIEEFSNCGKQQLLLTSIPVFVIADYNVSLYGAIEYMRLEGTCTF